MRIETPSGSVPLQTTAAQLNLQVLQSDYDALKLKLKSKPIRLTEEQYSGVITDAVNTGFIAGLETLADVLLNKNVVKEADSEIIQALIGDLRKKVECQSKSPLNEETNMKNSEPECKMQH